jgi:hypothetical protein
MRIHSSFVFAVAAIALAGVLAPSASTLPAGSHELPESPSWRTGKFAPLVPGTTYRASRVSLTPSVRSAVAGWVGTQLVTHQFGKVRYESVVFLRGRLPGGEIDLVTGPAMTMSPRATVSWAWTRQHDPFAPVRRWTVGGWRAYAFDGTNQGPFPFTVIGRNPPEVQVDPGQSFRMAAISVHGQTVALIVRSSKQHFARFLPLAARLLSSLRFHAV